MDNNHNWNMRHRTHRSFNRDFKPSDPGFLVWTMGDRLKENMCKGISHLLMLEAFMKWELVPLLALEMVEYFVPFVIDGIIRAFP